MKPIKAIAKLIIPAGQATPAPPIGPSLAQHGINIQEFCKQFNEVTRERSGEVLPAEITVFEDRTFAFRVKNPPVSFLLKKAAGIEKGSGEVGKKNVATLSADEVREIAERKLSDLNTANLDEAVKIVVGTARSMGIEIAE